MPETEWEELEIVSGDLQAEIIRGLLEASDIPVVMLQEGVGKSVYRVAIGPLAEVQILVPKKFIAEASQILNDYYTAIHDETNDDSLLQGLDDEDIDASE